MTSYSSICPVNVSNCLKSSDAGTECMHSIVQPRFPSEHKSELPVNTCPTFFSSGLLSTFVRHFHLCWYLDFVKATSCVGVRSVFSTALLWRETCALDNRGLGKIQVRSKNKSKINKKPLLCTDWPYVLLWNLHIPCWVSVAFFSHQCPYCPGNLGI